MKFASYPPRVNLGLPPRRAACLRLRRARGNPRAECCECYRSGSSKGKAVVRMRKNIAWAVFAGFMIASAVAFASGDWSAAERKYDEFKRGQEALKALTPEEVRKLVTAICAADEDERKSVADDIKSRVEDNVEDKYDDLEDVKDDALKLLEEVQRDDDLKDKQDKAKELAEDVKRRWDIVDRMTKSLRGANHPVVAWLLKQGQDAHEDRQERCDADEFVLASGKRVDCLMATGSTCKVIELKPDNSRAIGRGVSQARGYADELNKELKDKESAIIKKLVDKDSDFARCEVFEDQVDCYKLCPDINEQGEFREVSVSWRTDC